VSAPEERREPLSAGNRAAPLRLVRTPPWAPFLHGTVNPWWDGEPVTDGCGETVTAGGDETPVMYFPGVAVLAAWQEVLRDLNPPEIPAAFRSGASQ
jgi:hypothetical protein